jgi:hypothetical protein
VNAPLTATELEAVRDVGRAVLVARRDSGEDLAILAVGQELDALRTELQALLLPSAGGGATPAIRERIDALRVQRVLLAARVSSGADAVTAAKAAHVAAAAERVERDVLDALGGDEAEGTRRLLHVMRRLERQTLAERRAARERERSQATPPPVGSTTLTKHR